jgi:hypothetical protein
MVRAGFTCCAFLLLAAWAGAQGPPLTVDVQLRLLRENRTLLNDLVSQGVELSASDDLVTRTEQCEATVRTLGAAIRLAAAAQNADRVAELGDHLNAVVTEALIPNLEEGRQMINPNSPEAAKLEAVRAKAAGNLGDLRDALPTSGKFGESDKVKDLRGKLDALKERMKDK